MLVNIQLLRFIAATMVVAYHASAHIRDAGTDPNLLFLAFEATGFAGVDIFFVISGFIMAYTTQGAAGNRDSWAFFRRRIARIYSGYWPFLLLGIGFFSLAKPEFLASIDLFKNAVLWPTYPLIIAVAWTLIFEMYFYCFYALVLWLPENRRSLTLKLLFLALAVWVVISQYYFGAYDKGNLETMGVAEYYMVSPYFLEFIAGAMLCAYLKRQPSGPSWRLLLAGVLLFSLSGFINNHYFAGGIEQGYFIFYRVLAFGIPALLIVAGIVRLERHTVAPKRFSILLGGASYAIYLSHILILAASQHLGLNRALRGQDSTLINLVFVLYIGLIVAYSALHYVLIEKRLHRYLRVLLRVPPSGRAGIEPAREQPA